MRIAILQSGNNGFFPRFYRALRSAIVANGDDCRLFAPDNGSNRHCVLPAQQRWGTRVNWHVHNLLFKLTGTSDVYSHLSTWSLIRKLDRYAPDVLHMHVVNDCMLNMPMLVRHVNKRGIKVVWTMHDCRAFTGGCPYPDEAACERWKSGCGDCPLWRKYTHTFSDCSMRVWNVRGKWHNAIERLHIVTPSNWLAGFVRESFLKDKPLSVIYNGVDLDVFSTVHDVHLRKKHALAGLKIVLGVANYWEDRKGLGFFVELSRLLPDNYRIVLVGTLTEEQKAAVPDSILCIGRCSSADELAAWYQEADVLANPTMSDNFPTTNIEALASGTPVVTFDTGGSGEAVDESTGVVVRQGCVEELRDAIVRVCSDAGRYSKAQCLARSRRFSNGQYAEYVTLYHSL